MPNFGKKASEYEKEREDASDEVWIKGFRDGETRIHFLDEPDDFVTYREHYEEAIGYFPCSEEPDCVGCKDDSPKVRDRSRKFAFHALNSESSQQIFKVGSRLQRTLKSKAQRLKTICDRDYTVIRSGKGMETTYDMESGDAYESSFDPKAEPLYDIGALLARRYADAVEAYTGEKDDSIPKVTWHGTKSDDEPGDTKRETKSEPKEEKKEAPKDEEKKVDTESKGEDKPADEAQAEKPSGSYPNPEDMTRPELAEWLSNPPNDKDGKKSPAVEFPANAPRSRLVKMVRDWQAANPPF